MMWLWAIVLVGLIVGGVLAARSRRAFCGTGPSPTSVHRAAAVGSPWTCWTSATRAARSTVTSSSAAGPSFFPKRAAEDHDAILFV